MTDKTFYNGIFIDYSRDDLIDDFGKKTLKDRYLLETENSPQEAFARAAVEYSDNGEMAQRIYDYASQHWFMFSTPILSNGGKINKGSPISCFLNYTPDSREGLSQHYDENIWLASNGGGIGGYWGSIRSDGSKTSNGSKSSGVVPFLHVVDSQMLAFSQGSTRRGSYAAYTDINHPEVEEFISIRKPTGGDANRKCLNLHNAINITDDFMKIIENCMYDKNAKDDWNLIDPHSKQVVKTVSAKQLWQAIIETRIQTGEPYIHFVDTSNKHLPDTQKELGLKVNGSNLCSEITLATSELRTAVCCLSSVNLEKFDEWKVNELFISDLVRFLDNVLTKFCNSVFDEKDYYDVINAKEIDELKLLSKPGKQGLAKAAYSALRERSIGLGTMGFHAYLQKNNIPFEGVLARSVNWKIFSHIKSEAEKETLRLGKDRGEAPDMIGTGKRNAHLMAIAPNASSSIICGNTSPSIEPIRANVYTHKTLSGSFLVKNKWLEKLLTEKEKNTSDIWKSIIEHHGSVQHLEFLSDWEKDVFKTAIEIDQMWVVEHAGKRQEYICQAQSVNLFFRADEYILTLHNIHYAAWKQGLKTLYYCRSEAIHRVENISKKIERKIIEMPKKIVQNEEVCLSCEG